MDEVVFGLLIGSSVPVIILVWIVLKWVWLKPMKMEKYFKEQGITGPPYRLLYGNVKEMVNMMNTERSKPMELSHNIVPRLLPFVHQSVERYGKTFVCWTGPTPKVSIMDPTLMRDILSNKFGHFAKMRPSPLGKLLAEGVINYDGEKWVKHRRIITPAFHLEKLKLMLPAFYRSCGDLVRRWQTLVSKGPGELDVWPYLQSLTADVISRTAFGSSYEGGKQIFQLQSEQADLIMQVTRSIYIPGSRFLPTKRNKRMKEIHRQVHTLLRDIVKSREEAIKSGEVSKNDLLGILLESNRKELQDGGNTENLGMTINEVIEECKLFYFAGQETTSTLLVWTMIVLSMHPEWQQKAREEVLQVFGGRKPDFEGLGQLKVVTMVLYEVLRLYPPVIMLTRATYKKMKVGEVSLPPGVLIQMPILLVHHDPELWGEDVEEFKPERFSEGISKATKDQACFLPFGWGPRICIGQTFALIEAKMAVTMMLQNFSFELSAKYKHAPTTVITVHPQYGAQLILRNL
ncbi:hypothetical protein ACHQM5_017356 [Ranunculus cassubicifolius]